MQITQKSSPANVALAASHPELVRVAGFAGSLSSLFAVCGFADFKEFAVAEFAVAGFAVAGFAVAGSAVRRQQVRRMSSYRLAEDVSMEEGFAAERI